MLPAQLIIYLTKCTSVYSVVFRRGNQANGTVFVYALTLDEYGRRVSKMHPNLFAFVLFITPAMQIQAEAKITIRPDQSISISILVFRTQARTMPCQHCRLGLPPLRTVLRLRLALKSLGHSLSSRIGDLQYSTGSSRCSSLLERSYKRGRGGHHFPG